MGEEITNIKILSFSQISLKYRPPQFLWVIIRKKICSKNESTQYVPRNENANFGIRNQGQIEMTSLPYYCFLII